MHAEIEQAIDALELLTSEPAPHLGEVSGARYRLARASRARSALLNNGLYRLAAARATPLERAGIEDLQSEAARMLACSAGHIGRWTVDEIRARWSEYCAASREMRAEMRRRIRAERAILYPLLDEASTLAA